MCRLLGYATPTARTAAELLGTEPCEEWQSMGRLHRDGWGTAWLQTDARGTTTVHRHRDPDAGTNSEHLHAALHSSPSRARLVHLRLATEGMATGEANTHPFQYGDIVLAHNGSIRPVERLRALVSESELARVGGTTDSAILFALILRRVDAGQSLFDAVTAVVTSVREELPGSAINLLVLTPSELIATHANSGAPLPEAEFDAVGRDTLPRDHADHYYRLSYQRLRDGGIIVSSSGLETTGWQEVPQNSAFRVDLDTWEVSSRDLSHSRAAA